MTQWQLLQQMKGSAVLSFLKGGGKHLAKKHKIHKKFSARNFVSMDTDPSEQNTEPPSTTILSAQGQNQGHTKVTLYTLTGLQPPGPALALTGNSRCLEPSSTHVKQRPQTSLCSLLIVNICSAQLWIISWHTKKISPTDSKGCWVYVFLFFFLNAKSEAEVWLLG